MLETRLSTYCHPTKAICMTRLNRPFLTCLAVVVALASASSTCAEPATPGNGYVALDGYVAPVLPSKALYRTQSGASLHETLNSWAKQAGWKPVRWNLPEDTDFTLGDSRLFNSDVELATKAVLDAIGSEANLTLEVDRSNRVISVGPKQ